MSNIIKVKNGIRYEMNGWTYISIKGGPKERGYAYGKLIKEDMKELESKKPALVIPSQVKELN